MTRSFARAGFLVVVCFVGLICSGAVDAIAQEGPCSYPGCEDCPDASESVFDTLLTLSPCNTDPDLPGWAKFKYQVVVKDAFGTPIEDFINMNLDYTYGACHAAALTGPDAPSDENGLLIWSDNLTQPLYAPDGCGAHVVPYYQQCGDSYFVIPGTDIYSWGGFRNIDQDENGLIATYDLSRFQQAFQNNGPAYQGDFSRDKVVSLGDLSLFSAHFNACNDAERGVVGAKVDVVQAASNEELGFYVHIVNALPEGVQPLPVAEGQAVTSVGSVGLGGIHKTVLLFAHGYDGLGGFHVKRSWPAEWEFEGLDEELLPGQLLGYPDDGFHEMKYAAVFDCLSGGSIRAVARFDVLVTQPGSVGIDSVAPLEIVNCNGQERVLLVQENGLVAGQKSERQEPEITRVVRLSDAKGGAGIDFEVTSEVPQALAATVYDVSGRLVRTLAAGRTVAGTHVVRWDGMTDVGARAPSGVYLVSFEVGPYRHVERALLMR